jgi:hypothetical protein
MSIVNPEVSAAAVRGAKLPELRNTYDLVAGLSWLPLLFTRVSICQLPLFLSLAH